MTNDLAAYFIGVVAFTFLVLRLYSWMLSLAEDVDRVSNLYEYEEEEPAMAELNHRPLYEIAEDIRKNWPNVSSFAEPYLSAMGDLDDINSYYGLDSARHIVMYFLSNAQYWRGAEARRIKAELNKMLEETK